MAKKHGMLLRAVLLLLLLDGTHQAIAVHHFLTMDTCHLKNLEIVLLSQGSNHPVDILHRMKLSTVCKCRGALQVGCLEEAACQQHAEMIMHRNDGHFFPIGSPARKEESCAQLPPAWIICQVCLQAYREAVCFPDAVM
jgi:hypothetical protein